MSTALMIDQYCRDTGLRRENVLAILVAEAFIRRAAMVGGPFMLKGSYVTRQYLVARDKRLPGDLDWVGTGDLNAEVLNAWAMAVTSIALDDGVCFRNFADNTFWRMIDYAMDDDFPTVNTDLLAWVGGEECELYGMDVSFGLRLDPPPIPLLYQPISGEAFMVPLTCPLTLQIAWKLHQTLVRPRFKDVVDLVWLLESNPVDSKAVMQALQQECAHDGTPIVRFDWLLDGTLGQHPALHPVRYGGKAKADLQVRWQHWTGRDPGSAYLPEMDAASVFQCVDEFPPLVDDMLKRLADDLRGVGLTRDIIT